MFFSFGCTFIRGTNQSLYGIALTGHPSLMMLMAVMPDSTWPFEWGLPLATLAL